MTSELGCETVSISKAEEQSGGVSVHLGGGHNRQTDTHGEGEGGRRERRGTEKYKQYENE